MFVIIEKSETRLLIEYGYANQPGTRRLEIVGKKQEDVLYRYVHYLNLYVAELLDRIVQEADLVRKNFDNWGYGSVLNKQQTLDWWHFLGLKEKWVNHSNSLERYTMIRHYDFSTVLRFGSIVAALVNELQTECIKGIHTCNYINKTHLWPFLESYQKQAS